MKVYVDDQVFTLQPRGGISHYFVQLMRAFRADPALGVELTAPPFWSANRHLLEAGLGRPLPTGLGRRHRVQRAANRWHRSGAPDVVHHTFYDRAYLRRFADARLRVVTVYDMIPELLRADFPGGNPHRDKREFVAAADLVLCISEATRRDLVEVYGRPTAPVVVTPLGVDDRFGQPAARPAALPPRYVLFVGKRGGYKDFTVLAQAYAEARLPADINLVTVGGGSLSDDEQALLARLGLSGRVVQATLTDADMPGAYSHAWCFVFPSRYEGFGLPTLEAMSAGCPTVLARSSSHPEVGGAAVLYVQPGDTAGLADALRTLTQDPDLRERLGAAGRERAAAFSWRRTAELTAAAYALHGARR